MPADRVFAGDDEQYFPDFGVWLKPGDPAPDGVPDDDARFVAASSKARSSAKSADNEE